MNSCKHPAVERAEKRCMELWGKIKDLEKHRDQMQKQANVELEEKRKLKRDFEDLSGAYSHLRREMVKVCQERNEYRVAAIEYRNLYEKLCDEHAFCKPRIEALEAKLKTKPVVVPKPRDFRVGDKVRFQVCVDGDCAGRPRWNFNTELESPNYRWVGGTVVATGREENEFVISWDAAWEWVLYQPSHPKYPHGAEGYVELVEAVEAKPIEGRMTETGVEWTDEARKRHQEGKLIILDINDQIAEALDALAEIVHKNAVDKGFVKAGERRNPAELLALIHSEISECLEGLRKGEQQDEHCPAFLSSEIELADAIIRIADMSAERGYRLGAAVAAKMAFNATRPHKHGKTF